MHYPGLLIITQYHQLAVTFKINVYLNTYRATADRAILEVIRLFYRIIDLYLDLFATIRASDITIQ
jgi:hypothetical protein